MWDCLSISLFCLNVYIASSRNVASEPRSEHQPLITTSLDATTDKRLLKPYESPPTETLPLFDQKGPVISEESLAWLCKDFKYSRNCNSTSLVRSEGQILNWWGDPISQQFAESLTLHIKQKSQLSHLSAQCSTLYIRHRHGARQDQGYRNQDKGGRWDDN